MLAKNRLPVLMLAFVFLFLGVGFPWGETGYAQTSGSASQSYSDSYGVTHRVIGQPELDVKVWVDKGEGSVYHPGDDMKIYFEASRDCYLVIYNIDTRGYVHLLYPVDSKDDFFVEGQRVYRIPDRFDDYGLTVDGPEGMEYLQAVASFEQPDLPNFPGEYEYEGEVYAYRLDEEDPFEFMSDVNGEIAPSDYASDVCVFSVEYEHPRWYYHPDVVYVDRPVDLYWGGVYLDYPWGVEVWIDGVYYGITPITIPALVVGRHYLSFWFDGCWIWRDWFHVRRGHTARIWADCGERYRYVRERFVEKSYRTEKAERRRGSERGGSLVRPIRRTDGRMIATSEPRRVITETRSRVEESVKTRLPEDRFTPTRVEQKAQPREIEKTARRATIQREGRSGGADKPPVKTRLKAEPVRSQTTKQKVERKEVTTSDKKAPKATEKVRKESSSKPRPEKTGISAPQKRTTGTTSSGAAKTPVRKTDNQQPAKRRR
jgi:hypothetical protein